MSANPFNLLSPFYVTARVLYAAIVALAMFALAVAFAFLAIHPDFVFRLSALAVSFCAATAGVFFGRQAYAWTKLL